MSSPRNQVAEVRRACHDNYMMERREMSWEETYWGRKKHSGVPQDSVPDPKLTSGSPILSPCSDHGSGPGTQEFQYSFIPSIPSCSLSCALSGPPTHPLRSCLVVTSTGRPSLVLQIKLGFPVICSRSILGLL